MHKTTWLFLHLCCAFKFWMSTGMSSDLFLSLFVELLYKFLQFLLNKQHKTDGVLSSTQQITLGKIDVLLLSSFHAHTFCHFSRVPRACLCVCGRVCVCVSSEAGTLNWQSCENSATEIRSLSIITTPLSHRKQILAG